LVGMFSRGLEGASPPVGISCLIAPTAISMVYKTDEAIKGYLSGLKDAGADKIGVAIDGATESIFDATRGSGVKGPHRWEHYWKYVRLSSEVFAPEDVGIHLMIGLGETEREAVEVYQRAQDLGVRVHLFSFFSEEGSAMDAPQPGIGTYRRLQLARYLMEVHKTDLSKMEFNDMEQIVDFGVGAADLDEAIDSGIPFLTSGCSSKNYRYACNRPYSNSTPFQAMMGECRNFPFPPDEKDLELIRQQLLNFDPESFMPTLDKAEIPWDEL
ncbi:MAG: hypothetical protein ACTSU5_03585, partial [Promethearchaeota archaeon]